MYDRAPRDLIKIAGSTNHNVGPGSYDADVPTKSRFKAGKVSSHIQVNLAKMGL